MRYIYKILLLCVMLSAVACSPVNMFTRLKRLPREHSMNFPMDGVRAPKTSANKNPWIVYSDRAGNQSLAEPGGQTKLKEAGFLEAFLVTGRKGDYLKLIRYNEEHIAGNRMDRYVKKRKEAEYYGWMHISRLLLSPVSYTDIRTGMKNKYITGISDTLAIRQPKLFFETGDSLKLFTDPGLTERAGLIGLHEIVYVMKLSGDGKSALIATKPEITPEEAPEKIVGWISCDRILPAGQQLFGETGLNDPEWMSGILKYEPLLSPLFHDSLLTYRSYAVRPVIDRSDNRVYNIDGEPITFAESREVEKELKRINVLFVVEPSTHLREQYPVLLNIIQNFQPLFARTGEPFRYNFGAVVSLRNETFTLSPGPDYTRLTDALTALSLQPQCLDADTTRASWSALREAIRQVENTPQATNLFILIGERGGTTERADSTLMKQLGEVNGRLLAFQLYAGKEDRYNNFVLQTAHLMQGYAREITRNKRRYILYADQVRRQNRFREDMKNGYSLWYPEYSMTQGGLLFPEKERVMETEVMVHAVDTFLHQVKADNRLLIESLHKAFSTVGNTRDKYEQEFRETFALADTVTINTEFKEVFNGFHPVYLTETQRTTLPDTVVQYRLLLSEAELEKHLFFLEQISAGRIEKRDPKAGKKKKTVPKISVMCWMN